MEGFAGIPRGRAFAEAAYFRPRRKYCEDTAVFAGNVPFTMTADSRRSRERNLGRRIFGAACARRLRVRLSGV